MKISKQIVLTFVMALVALVVSAAAAQQQLPGGSNGSQSFFSDPNAADAHCGYTDESTSGPFYISGTAETDNLNGGKLPGELMKISGVVYDGSTGEAIPNAQVEVWHADGNGVYYPEARGDAANFNPDQIKLRGTVLADETGAYSFTSIKPGIYEGRRRHIHYYITAPGYLPLFTQTYWPDDPNIAIDGTDANTEACRYLTFSDMTYGGTEATFDIYMRPDPNYVPTPEATAEATTAAEVTAACTRLNLNTLTQDDVLNTIPNFPSRMVREFLEYRPYVSIQQFRREIGKYVGEAQTAEWEAYVYVPVDVNNSDADTLKQIPGVDDATAAALIAARPYASNDAFLTELGTFVTAQQAADASCYLDVTA